jgi:hypothetical protein
LGSLSDTNYSSRNPDDMSKLELAGSKLLQDDIFAGWLTDDLRVTSLLLTGVAGSGKISMCRVVENYLRTLLPSSEIFVVALYFSVDNRDKVQSLQTVLAFIVETMLHQRPQPQKYYNRLMLTGEGPLEVGDCLRVIHRARQDFQKFYILIDALDECDAQQARVVVERLTRLRNPIKIFATSRQPAHFLTAHFSDHVRMENIHHDGITEWMWRNLARKVPVDSNGVPKNDSTELYRIAEKILKRSGGQ